jgi:hypothetical protein
MSQNIYPKTHPLKSIFRGAKLSQAAIANHIGISREFLNAILMGYKKPPTALELQLREMAMVLKIRTLTQGVENDKRK